MSSFIESINHVPQRLALLAGEGELPLVVAREALRLGYEVHVYALYKDCVKAFQALTPHVQVVSVAQPRKAFLHVKASGCETLVFAGKVNKWLLFRELQWDTYALDVLRHMPLKHDDGMMAYIIQRLWDDWGIKVLPQTWFMQPLFKPSGVLSHWKTPTLSQWRDIAYGFHLACEMGRLDVGQSVVVSNTMAIAIEAIEGTDECIKRAGHWTRKQGGTLVKTAKPQQDNRFDVPTVGIRTLKHLKENGLGWLATEANRTIYMDWPAMEAYAQKHNIGIVSSTWSDLSPYHESIHQGVPVAV